MKKLILIAFFLIFAKTYSQEQTFDIVVLRSVTSNPTTSLTGGPIKVGSLIFNSLSGKISAYDGNDWEPLALFSEIPANKQLSLASNILALEDGGTVDLSPYLDYNATDSAKVANLPSNQGSVNSDFEARIAVNDLKNGITVAQISNIITNNAKVGITPQQVSDIISNNSKVGITTQQASDIQSNNAKVSGDGSISNNSDVDGSGVSNGQVLKWNSANSRWEAEDDNVGGAGSDGNDFPTSATLSGGNLTIVIPNQSDVVVDVSPLLDNTDGQTITDLSLSGSILSVTLSGGNTETVDLSTISGGSAGPFSSDTNGYSTNDNIGIGGPSDANSNLVLGSSAGNHLRFKWFGGNRIESRSSSGLNNMNLDASALLLSGHLWFTTGKYFFYNGTDGTNFEIRTGGANSKIQMQRRAIFLDGIQTPSGTGLNIFDDGGGLVALSSLQGQENLNVENVTGHGVVLSSTDQSDELEARLGNNKTLYLPAGQYYFDNGFDLPATTNLTIYGDGENTIIESPTRQVVNVTGDLVNVTFKNLTLKSTATDATSNGNHSLFHSNGHSATNVKFEDIWLDAPLASVNGIKFIFEGTERGDGLYFERLKVKGAGIGRMVVEIQNHTLDATYRYKNVYFYNNHVRNPGLLEFPIGLSLSGPGENAHFYGNLFEGNDNRSIEVLGSNGVFIQGNMFDENVGGIVVTENAAASTIPSKNIVVSDNIHKATGTDSGASLFKFIEGLTLGNEIYDITNRVAFENVTDGNIDMQLTTDAYAGITVNDLTNTVFSGGFIRNERAGNALIRVEGNNASLKFSNMKLFKDSGVNETTLVNGSTTEPDFHEVERRAIDDTFIEMLGVSNAVLVDESVTVAKLDRSSGLLPTTNEVYRNNFGAPGWFDLTALSVSYDNTASGLTATNVKAAIDENAATASSGISTANQNRINNENLYKFRNPASDEITTGAGIEATASGDEGKKIWNYVRGVDGTRTVTLDGSHSGKILQYTTLDSNAELNIIPTDSVTILYKGRTGDNNSITLNEEASTVIVTQMDDIPNTYILNGDWDEQFETSFFTNLFTGAGADGEPNSTDISGFSGGTAIYSLNTNASNVRTGTTSMEMSDDGDAGTSEFTNYALPALANGVTRTFTAWFKAPSTVRVGIRGLSPASGITYVPGNGAWQQLSVTVVGDGNASSVRWYIDEADGNTTGLKTAYIDDILVTD